MRNVKSENREIYSTLKRIEDDVQVLKVLLMKSTKRPRKIVTLEGVLKGVRIEEKDIEEAQKLTFKSRDK